MKNKIFLVIAVVAILFCIQGCSFFNVPDSMNGDPFQNNGNDVSKDSGNTVSPPDGTLGQGLTCADENKDSICDSEQKFEKLIKKSDTSIPCPEELLKRDYSLPSSSGLGAGYYPLLGFLNGEGRAVYCPKGDKVGQNTNYRYCEAFLFDTSPITDSQGNIISEAKKIFGEAVINEIPSNPEIDGPEPSTKPVKLIDMKCYESYSELLLVEEEAPQTPTRVIQSAKNSCGSGNCRSNGVCCSSSSRYYCENHCYDSQNAAVAASQGRCNSWEIVC